MSRTLASGLQTRFAHGLIHSVRLELMALEDRLSPGQTGWGGVLAFSLLGPSLAALQLDAMASSVGAVTNAEPQLAEMVEPSSRQLGLGVAFQLESEPIAIMAVSEKPVDASLPIASSSKNDAPQSPTIGASSGLPNQAAPPAFAVRQSSAAVDINAGSRTTHVEASTAPQPYTGGGIGDRPLNIRPSTNGGERNSIVGPNVQTNSSFSCTSTTGKIQSETAIIDSGNVVVVGYNDFRGFYCPGSGFQVLGWAYSTDRGRTFTDGGPLPGGTANVGDPWLAASPDGSTIYMATLRSGLGTLGVLRGTVTGSGVSWAPATLMSGFGSYDKEAITVDPTSGAIYVSYTRLGDGIWMHRSFDGGASFLPAIKISTNANVQGSMPVVGPNGEVYVTWQANNGSFNSPTGIGFARSFDNGATWQVFPVVAPASASTIGGTDRSPCFPQIAVDTSGGPNHGNIYITYHSNHLGGGTAHDAISIRSTDGGTTWSTPARINDDGGSRDQWFATINTDSFGFVHSFFYDRRDTTGNNTDLYYARSADGVNWEPNVRVTSTSFLMYNHSDGSPDWGDYIKAEVQGKSAIVAYADGRNGDPDAFFTRVGNRD